MKLLHHCHCLQIRWDCKSIRLVLLLLCLYNVQYSRSPKRTRGHIDSGQNSFSLILSLSLAVRACVRALFYSRCCRHLLRERVRRTNEWTDDFKGKSIASTEYATVQCSAVHCCRYSWLEIDKSRPSSFPASSRLVPRPAPSPISAAAAALLPPDFNQLLRSDVYMDV